jgi:hypothetical protein
MSNDEGWGVQISIKHGPLDDRGNPQYMTNVRGYTATEIEQHLQHLADNAVAIQDYVNRFVSVGAVKGTFPGAEEVRQDERQYERPASRYGDNRGNSNSGQRSGGGFRNRDGEQCQGHGLPRKYKSGTSSKGNYFELLECAAPKNPCDVIWAPKE